MAAAPAAALAHCTHVRLFAHAHTGRTHVPKHMLRAASVRRVPGGFGPRVFACAESRPCLCLAVSGMSADCSCGAYWRRVREAFCKNLINGLGVKRQFLDLSHMPAAYIHGLIDACRGHSGLRLETWGWVFVRVNL